MLKKDITYTDPFTEQQVTETHYFHLPKAELVRMEMEEHGQKYIATKGDLAGQELTGMQAHLQRIVESENGKAVLKEFEEILRRSYLKRDGDKSLRSPEIFAEFQSSEAYSEFLWDLFTHPDEMAKFIQAVFPANLEEIAKEVSARAEAEQATSNEGQSASTPPEDQPGSDEWVAKRKPVIAAATPESPVDINRDDITLMSPADLQAGLADGRFKLA